MIIAAMAQNAKQICTQVLRKGVIKPFLLTCLLLKTREMRLMRGAIQAKSRSCPVQ